MRARVAALKHRMELFHRPESCQYPWPADASKVMTSWFSVLDYHPCVVADNLETGIDIWLHSYGCQDAIVENVEIMFDTSNMSNRRIERLVTRRRKTILKKTRKLANAPCKDKFYDPETTTTIATTWSTKPITTSTTTVPDTTTILTTTTTTAWESTTWSTSTTTWGSTPWLGSDSSFFGFGK